MATGLGEEKLQTSGTQLKDWPCVTSCSCGGVGHIYINISTTGSIWHEVNV